MECASTSSATAATAARAAWNALQTKSAALAFATERVVDATDSSHANTLDAGSGLDWFWEKYAKDSTNRKATDLVN
jgi:hypothetical protein